MKKPASISTLLALIAAFFLSHALPAYSQSAPADLDRDGIPNITDRDVDNDGILNGADRNIDGGTAQSGPLRGRYIGDNLLNDSPQELDMDADGLADDALNEPDIDGDGLPDADVRETDIDGDGLADDAATEADIDGDGLSDGVVSEQDIDGDGQLDTAVAETDIDGDGIADNATNETDIDGDGLADGVRGEVDIDGDASVNGTDTDVDGDGLANTVDSDMDGTGVVDDIFSGTDHDYLPDSEVVPVISYVAAEARKVLKIPANDRGLRVRVLRESYFGPYTGTIISGVWRYLSADQIQVWAIWRYPASDPSKLQLFATWGKNCVNANYPRGRNSFVTWEEGSEPVSFTYFAAHESETGVPPPVDGLTAAFGTRSSFERQDLKFSFQLSPRFPGLQPIIELQRTIQDITRRWNSDFEMRQLQ